MKTNINPEGEPVGNNGDSQNSRNFINGMPLEAFQAHQESMNDLFNELHPTPKEPSGDGQGLADAINQFQNGDGMVWANSMEELKDKVSSLPDNGGGDGNSGGGDGSDGAGDDGDGHKTVFSLVDGTTGTILTVTMKGECDREDALDAILVAGFHLRKNLRSEGEAADDEDLGKLAKAFDEFKPEPLPEMSVELEHPSFGQREEICMLVKNASGPTTVQIVRADTFPVLSAEFTDVSHGDVAAYLDEDVKALEVEFCFEPARFNIPAGQYFARIMDATTRRVSTSMVFTVKRDSLHTVKRFSQRTGRGHSAIHKWIKDGTIPAHLVVEKTKSCSKRRIYLSAEQFLVDAGKRKCRKHRRPNRRARTV